MVLSVIIFWTAVAVYVAAAAYAWKFSVELPMSALLLIELGISIPLSALVAFHHFRKRKRTELFIKNREDLWAEGRLGWQQERNALRRNALWLVRWNKWLRSAYSASFIVLLAGICAAFGTEIASGEKRRLIGALIQFAFLSCALAFMLHLQMLVRKANLNCVNCGYPLIHPVECIYFGGMCPKCGFDNNKNQLAPITTPK
jgi:hypothetical protein